MSERYDIDYLLGEGRRIIYTDAGRELLDGRQKMTSGILSDWQITGLVERQRMIEPFVKTQIKYRQSPDEPTPSRKLISYGVSSYGYDARVADEFKVFTNLNSTIVDPKNFDSDSFVNVQGTCIIPPNSFALARTVEYFRIPDNVLVICVGKSTYARCGIIVNVTPLEPGWHGNVTLEFSNTTPLPAKIYANEGAVQLLFFQASVKCETTYAERNGKYHRQRGVTLPKA